MVLRKGSDYFPLHFHAHMRLNNPGGIKQVVMRSKGIGAYCPVYYYLDELANGTVCEVLPEWKFPVQQIYISRKDQTELRSIALSIGLVTTLNIVPDWYLPVMKVFGSEILSMGSLYDQGSIQLCPAWRVGNL